MLPYASLGLRSLTMAKSGNLETYLEEKDKETCSFDATRCAAGGSSREQRQETGKQLYERGNVQEGRNQSPPPPTLSLPQRCNSSVLMLQASTRQEPQFPTYSPTMLPRFVHHSHGDKLPSRKFVFPPSAYNESVIKIHVSLFMAWM